MTSPKESFPFAHAGLQSRYQAVSTDARYGHYVRIPERICRCLDYFKVASSRENVAERLHSYYLFIGVVDDLLDSGRAEAGREILKLLGEGAASFDEETRRSCAGMVTEVLKSHISPESYPSVLKKLEELYEAVLRERKSAALTAYVEERKTVGRLTAELSYLLIRPLLDGEREDLCRFLQKVGEIGCLVDSVIDLKSDARQGLLGFNPTFTNHLKLTGHMLIEGLRLSLKHPRLFGLFLEGIGDDLLDSLRARRRPWAASGNAAGAGDDYAFERVA